MKSTFSFYMFLSLLLICRSLNAQHSQRDCYTTDGILYNGTLYNYNIARSTKGTPFLEGEDFLQGSITLRGNTYSIPLNYDVYNQKLVFQFTSKDRGLTKLTVSEAWLQSFTYGKSRFEFLTGADSAERIYKVIGSDSLKVLYYQYKELVVSASITEKAMRFTPVIRESYLFRDNNIYRYTGNRSFIRLFEKDDQSEIRKFIRQNRINVRKASDDKILRLVEFCKMADV